jgi:hypothetical protein
MSVTPLWYDPAGSIFGITPPADIAWAAGLFEGEGCFTSTRRVNLTPRAELRTTDIDVLQRFARIVRVGTIRSERASGPRHHKPVWAWSAGGANAIAVAELLLPHLGARRTKRANLLIATYYAERTATCEECGIPFIRKRSDQLLCGSRCQDKRSNRRRSA